MTITAEQRERGERLRALVEHLKGKPVEYGVDDCSMLPAQWVADVTGREFDWPVYGSRDGAAAIIDAAGGLVNVWLPVVRSLGLIERFDVPEIGDIGIIDTSHGHVGGIWLHGQTFLWRADQGVRVLGVRSHRIVRIWQV
ncbi:DUF6950 family protein [Mesorhizobium xinjiangense]|uniref:DUF6950 family protein n=1 Tax=Mesorhizobium xinjiangense TaxID=2678685 RepID=UPI0012EE5DB2|nr:hypothetical protein [Mesorhizobium xinjiangense]